MKDRFPREYGGCLPLEKIKETNTNPYANYERIEVSAGRECIAKACEIEGRDKILLPLYLCPYVKEYLEKRGIHVNEYNIDRQFAPVVSYSSDTMILWTRYYGLLHADVQEKILNEWDANQVIFDNTQSFFSPPVELSYNVYSIRKFIGVPDGAYLIGPGVQMKDGQYECGVSWKFLEIASESSNSAYDDYIENSHHLQFRKGMSRLTREYLKGVDFQYIRQKRQNNFKVIHEILKNYNELSMGNVEDVVCYPFLRDGNESVRRELLENNIYTSMWWKRMLFDRRANDFEKYLTSNLIPIPIDQRYSTDDVMSVAKLIADMIN